MWSWFSAKFEQWAKGFRDKGVLAKSMHQRGTAIFVRDITNFSTDNIHHCPHDAGYTVALDVMKNNVELVLFLDIFPGNIFYKRH